jgi:hypothetical protein
VQRPWGLAECLWKVSRALLENIGTREFTACASLLVLTSGMKWLTDR